MRVRLRTLSDTGFAVGAGLLCLAWALAAWLTVIPNQDMLADAIQVQSLIHDPRIVLAFPGQKHAGTVEYPIQVLAELIAPGNYYVHTLARVLLAFVTGFLAAKLFTTIYSKGPRWPFIAAIVVGPTIIHGLSGPGGNSVGVFWLVGNYDTSWLLVTAGALLLARNLKRPQPVLWVFPLAGLLIGLGFFAHPNVMLLIAPLAVLVLLTFPIRFTQLALTLLGAVAGVIPSLVSYVINADITTWDPSHPPFIAMSIYLNILGLSGIPSYFTVVLPYAIGLPTSQDVIPGVLQSGITWVFFAAVCVAAVIGLVRSLVRRSRPAPGTTLALAWCAAFAAMILFATFVDPVWFYATSLAVLFWITVGALPQVAPTQETGTIAAAALIVIAGVSTITHNWSFYSAFGEQVTAKQQRLADLHETASQIESAGAGYVYGSYYDAIPIGYASAFRLRTVTSTYDRFPLSDAERQQASVAVATRMNPDEPWGQLALDNVETMCVATGRILVTPRGPYGIFTCPPSAIDSRQQEPS